MLIIVPIRRKHSPPEITSTSGTPQPMRLSRSTRGLYIQAWGGVGPTNTAFGHTGRALLLDEWKPLLLEPFLLLGSKGAGTSLVAMRRAPGSGCQLVMLPSLLADHEGTISSNTLLEPQCWHHHPRLKVELSFCADLFLTAVSSSVLRVAESPTILDCQIDRSAKGQAPQIPKCDPQTPRDSRACNVEDN